MDEQQTPEVRRPNPRRRKRTKMQIFKEVYLPAIIAGSALLLIFIFAIGSIVRGVQRSQLIKEQQQQAAIAEEQKQAQLRKEATQLLTDATVLAQQYDFDGAISLLNSFQGDRSQFPEFAQKYTEFEEGKNSLVLWNDPSKVVNLSFHVLIADPARAFDDETYGSSYNRNFITTDEFSAILQQLYDNNYVLISLSDLTSDGKLKDLYLPEGKKPLILTQTQVNYYTYMVDSDGDKLPDAGGAGFASKLVIDSNGNLTCEMVDASGQTTTGAYDLVPILDAFVQTHPDFSYRGAKALLAVTGYDGLFGYRTNPGAATSLGADVYNEQSVAVTEVIDKLRATGYEIACYTYGNTSYGSILPEKIQEDLNKWRVEVAPILGNVDTLVYAQNKDIADSTVAYSGDKFDILSAFGFRNYLGFCTNGNPWITVEDTCFRQGRIMVTGTNLINNPSWFSGIFDAPTVVSNTRPPLD